MTSAQIFVIDSAPSNLVLVLSILRRAGFTNALPFTDAQTALDAVEHVHPDLVLVDLDTPGYELAGFVETLRSRAHGDPVPVIALGGESAGDALTAALHAGVNDYASKPINESEILLRVRNLLLAHDAPDPEPEPRPAPAPAPAPARVAIAAPPAPDETHAVREILERGGPDMVFQPIVALDSDATVGVEALARFGSESHPPDHWFAYAATLGLGTDLEIAAIATAFRGLDRLDPAFQMSVNVSPATLLDERFPALLATTDVSRITFELPQRAITDDASLRTVTDRLRAGGARISVDQSRADYAGLRHVLDLSPDSVKLDMALTRDIDTDPVKRTLAASLLHLAREIGATVTAVGIETQAELDTLRELGVDHGQGFHLGRPSALSPTPAAPAPAPDARSALHEAVGLMLDGGRRVTAFAIDIDDLAEVDRAYGRDVADEVVRTMKSRLQGTLRPGHIVSPDGDDAFVVVSDTVADDLEALTLAHRIRDVLGRRIGFAAIQVEISVSVGIASAHDTNPTSLLNTAHAALIAARQAGASGIELHAAAEASVPDLNLT